MNYPQAALIVIGAVVAAVLASLLVARFVTIQTRRNHYEVGAQVFQQVGVMFAVLLAFVFSEAWGEYNIAAQAINQECGALHGAAMLANALPNAVGRPVNRAIVIYAKTVIDTEWPMMARYRRRSPKAAQAFRVVFDTAARLPVTAPADVAIRAQMVTLLSEAHAERETRTFQINQALPPVMWAVLITLAIVLEAFVLFASVEWPGHVLFATSFIGCTVMVLTLVRMLDYPFEGALTLSDHDFVKVMGEVSDMVAGG